MTSPRPPLVAKQELRDRLLVRRRGLPAGTRQQAGEAIARHLSQAPEVLGARSVAVYVSMGTEPPTDALVVALHRRGCRVLAPVLLPDLDLAWAEHTGPDSLRPGPRGMRQPVGPRLAPDTLAAVDVVLCPGLAVDRTGLRLGRGGGSYDRALARLPEDAWSCVLLYDHEVLDDGVVPGDVHDRRVAAAATPAGVLRFG